METDLIQYEVKPTDSGNHPSAVRDGFTHRVVQWTGLVNRADGVDWTPKTLGLYESKAAANRAMAQFNRA